VFSEKRQSTRKVLKVKATLSMEGTAPVTARTVDIGANGMCVAATQPLTVGQSGQVSFELFFEGKASIINVRSKVMYCIFSNGEFKVGFQFLNLGLASMTLLAKFMR
jgi:hypothetical protein